MQKTTDLKGVNRIIDANINRLKEGLRVCEEIPRFILNDEVLTKEVKKIRHKIDNITRHLPSQELIKERSSLKDVGKEINLKTEFKRKSCQDIFSANIQRVKESIRVLEEFTKLINISIAQQFKKARYDIYELEKKINKELATLYDHR